MPLMIATIEVLVDASDDAEASDALSETMREHLRVFVPSSSIVDWRYSPQAFYWQLHDGAGFEHVDGEHAE